MVVIQSFLFAIFFVCFCDIVIYARWPPVLVQPEQIHILVSYGASPSEMVVTWVTLNDTHQTPMVEYGIQALNLNKTGKTTLFQDGGPEHRLIYIHRVTLTNLTPWKRYLYHCGGKAGWSSLFFFKTMRDDPDYTPMLGVYGDMGNDNARSLPYLQEEAQKGTLDAILHVGDFAYDLNTDNARVGDEFMRQLEPVAGFIPYMVCVGNHEKAYNFSNYRKRFSMPAAGGDGEGMWFSWNIGKAHIISFSTEVYYFSVTKKNIKAQYDWLDKDLTEANKPVNRQKRPWIIVMGHKPMYCSSVDKGELCRNPNNPVRNGNKAYNLSLEVLFYKHGVDVEFYAHEHSYERLWPVYKSKVCNGSYDNPYVNPKAPVHIVTGSAGNREAQTPFVHKGSKLSAFHTDDFGYTRMLVQNDSHLYLEEMSVNKGGAILDKIWIVKDKHGAGIYDCHI